MLHNQILRITARQNATSPSARNQFAGMIQTIRPGATAPHVTIAMSRTITITASITHKVAEELGLKTGMSAWAAIKASQRDGRRLIRGLRCGARFR